jgi:hypothetical protein
VRRAEVAGITWPVPVDLDDVALEGLLFSPKDGPRVVRPAPADRHAIARFVTDGFPIELTVPRPRSALGASLWPQRQGAAAWLSSPKTW